MVINDVEYLTVTEVARAAGVTRQTLWRWRQDGSIPRGVRYRGRQLLFTLAELQAIRDFAQRIEPAVLHTPAGDLT